MRRRPDANLTDFERRVVSLLTATNETGLGKALQNRWLDWAAHPFVRGIVARRTFRVGYEWMREFHPDRGVMLAANHRSFFDQWVLMLSLWGDPTLKFFDKIYFPVRSNYFYETRTGVLINYLMGGGSLYPPVFRDPAKADFNKYSVDRVIEFLADPDTMVGVHPEGTRGKGPDPYELLKAQPGIGQMILQGRPIVIPAFINGLSNDFIGTIRDTFTRGSRRRMPIIVVYGQPFDYSEFTTSKPRAALYKRCADALLDRIRELGEIEREVRGQIESGEIPDDHPGWVGGLMHPLPG